jgi:hypothetical protein
VQRTWKRSVPELENGRVDQAESNRAAMNECIGDSPVLITLGGQRQRPRGSGSEQPAGDSARGSLSLSLSV